jgi:hypothetical protein
MYKQMLILKKGETVPRRSDVTKDLFMRLFERPLLMIPMENAICLIYDRPEGKESFMPENPLADKSTVG